MNAKQFLKGTAIVGTVIGYSYLLHKGSFWAGRITGWIDGFNLLMETTKEYEKKECEKDRIRYRDYTK